MAYNLLGGIRGLGFLLSTLACAAAEPEGPVTERFPDGARAIAGLERDECQRSNFCRRLLARLELEETCAVITGTAAQIEAAVTRWENEGSLSPRVAAAARSADARFDVWIVTLGSPAALAGRVPDPTVSSAMKGEVVEAIEQVIGGIRFGGAVLLAGEATTRSERDAATLAEVMRFMLVLAEFHMGPVNGLMDLARRAELTVQANRVRLSLSLPAEEFERRAGAFFKEEAAPESIRPPG